MVHKKFASGYNDGKAGMGQSSEFFRRYGIMPESRIVEAAGTVNIVGM